jgi:DNA-binding CsgD family transcriptional regulator
MSWIIGEYVRQLPYLKERADIDSDSYNNAIMIEMVVEKMIKDDLLSEQENNIIWAVSAGYSYSEIARMLGLHRLTVSHIFKNVTDRISYMMGGELTDDAFFERIQGIEPLSEDDISIRFRQRIANV